MSKMKTTTVPESELEIYDEEVQDFVLNLPAKYAIQTADGSYLFLHTRSRDAAQKFIDSTYGAGFYKVKEMKQGQGSGDYSCIGSNTRKCFSPALKGLK